MKIRILLPVLTTTLIAFACGTSATTSNSKASTAQDDSDEENDSVTYSEQAKEVFRYNRCGKSAADFAVSALIDVIMEWGVDLPDEVNVEHIYVPTQNKLFRVVLNGDAAFEIAVDDQCKQVSSKPLNTVELEKPASSKMAELFALGNQHLGQGHYGWGDMGGAYTGSVNSILANEDHLQTATEVVKNYFAEWENSTTQPELITDRSRATIVALLEKMLVVGVDGEPESFTLANEFADKILALLTANPRFKLVAGTWSAIGADAQADYIALIDTMGSFIVLDQGYED